MKYLITVSIVLFSVVVYGQKQYFGLKSGIGFTNLFIDGDGSLNDFRIGFNGGLTYEYQFKSNLQIEVDFVYAQKGAKEDVIFTDQYGQPTAESTIHYNYDYLSLPIKGGYSFGNKLEGFINLGIVPSLLINAQLRIPGLNVSEDGAIDIKDDVQKIDLSGLVEIGGNYILKDRLLLFTSFAYQHSFTQLTAENYLSNSDVRHYGMILSLGVKFGIGG